MIDIDGREETNKIRIYQNALKSSLRKFHFFIWMKMKECNLADIPAPSGSIAKLLMSESGLDVVSAHVLTLDDFIKTRQILNGPTFFQRYKRYLLEYADALLILGFRFGLRRGEAMGLEADDLSPNWIKIHASDERDLKTPNSKRRLPCDPLVTDGEYCEQYGLIPELDLLLLLRDRANNLPTNKQKFLFHDPKLDEKTDRFEIESWDYLLNMVREAMQDASGNSLLHFHHLRHSFASWTFLRLMVAELENAPHLFPHLEHTSKWLNTAKQFRRELYLDPVPRSRVLLDVNVAADVDLRAQTENPNRSDVFGPTRKHTRAVSCLLGHAGPVITTEAYVHVFDRLLLPFVAESPLLRIDDVAKVGEAAGLKAYETSRLRRRLGEAEVDYRKPEQHRWGGHLETGLVPEIVRQHFPFLHSTDSPKLKSKVSQEPEWRRARWFLHRYALKRDFEKLEAIAMMCGLDSERAEEILDNWHLVSAIREADPPHNLRRARDSAFDYDKCKSVEIDAPRAPSQDTGEEIATLIANQVVKLSRAKKTRRQCHEFLLYYINNVWGTRDWVTFEGFGSVQLVKSWRKFLREEVLQPLGKDKSLHYHFFGRDPEIRKRWKGELGLHHRYKPSYHPEDWYTKPDSSRIGLQPSAAKFDQPIEGAVAIRFALTISALVELTREQLSSAIAQYSDDRQRI